MEIVQKMVLVTRAGDARPLVYRVAVEDYEPILVKEHLLGHVIGLVFGTDAPGHLKEVIYGPTGELRARVWINSAQAAALAVLMTEYALLRE